MESLNNLGNMGAINPPFDQFNNYIVNDYNTLGMGQDGRSLMPPLRESSLMPMRLRKQALDRERLIYGTSLRSMLS